MTNFEKVKEFMTMMGQEIKPEPELPRSLGTLELRLALIDEEFGELREAIINDDLIEAADGLAFMEPQQLSVLILIAYLMKYTIAT